jgi:large subunit ribosomal protein L3
MPGILGKKIGMTRIFEEDGTSVPMTVVQCEPNEILQVKNSEKDGYEAIVVGFWPLKKPSKNKKFRFVKEFKVADTKDMKIGDKVTLDILETIEKVSFTAVSKGKGFQGVIRRHHFSRGPTTHGSQHHREPGAVGCRAKPGRVFRGKKLPGRMGTVTVTTKKVPVAYIDKIQNLVGLKGPIPGPKNNLVIIHF